jgi:hypothetical protein
LCNAVGKSQTCHELSARKFCRSRFFYKIPSWMHAVRYGSFSSPDNDKMVSFSGIADTSSSRSFLCRIGLFSKWNVATVKAPLVVSVAAPRMMLASSPSRFTLSSSGGRSELSSSLKMVLWPAISIFSCFWRINSRI